ncbi:hypothetical protein HK099_004840 [Clydaea vesicula]|uniref:Pentatricopeptide repeat-containing protein n=1 Tax=Clydaea vesicula TaxID=447962 RepID=A0AAD5U1A0_9FUNG|nr:hypothetical protein HK099_004840 [Clydaea vesicula]KAJ3380504.1 hypothetical protein HDU92_005947 [Lobulomyces angularis]
MRKSHNRCQNKQHTYNQFDFTFKIFNHFRIANPKNYFTRIKWGKDRKYNISDDLNSLVHRYYDVVKKNQMDTPLKLTKQIWCKYSENNPFLLNEKTISSTNLFKLKYSTPFETKTTRFRISTIVLFKLLKVFSYGPHNEDSLSRTISVYNQIWQSTYLTKYPDQKSESFTSLLRNLKNVNDSGEIKYKLINDWMSEGNVINQGIFENLVRLESELFGPQSAENLMEKYLSDPALKSLNLVKSLPVMQSLITGCQSRKLFELSKKYFIEILNMNLKPANSVWQNFLKFFISNGKTLEVLEFYDALKKSNVTSKEYLQTHSLGILINALISSSLNPTNKKVDLKSGVESAARLFADMISNNVKPSIITINNLIAAYSKVENQNAVNYYYSLIAKYNLKPDLFIYTTMIYSMMKSSQVSAAEKLYQNVLDLRLKPDLVLYCSMIHGYTLNRQMNNALKLEAEMRNNVTNFTLVAFHVMIYLHCVNGDIKKGWERLEEMESCGFTRSEITYNMLIQGAGLLGDLSTAKSLYLNMQENDIKPTTTTYNNLIFSHSIHNDPVGALEWYSNMFNNGCEPDVYTFNILIRNNVKEGNFEGAMDSYKKLIDSGLDPSHKTFHPLLQYQVRRGNMKQVRVLQNQIKIAGLEPKIETHNVILQSQLLHKPNSSALLHEFKLMESEGLVPDIRTFDMIIRAYGSMGKTISARRWFNRALNTKGLIPDTQIFNSLIFGYAKHGRVEIIQEIIKEMEHYGLKPDRFTYKILLEMASVLKKRKDANELNRSNQLKLINMMRQEESDLKLKNMNKYIPPPSSNELETDDDNIAATFNEYTIRKAQTLVKNIKINKTGGNIEKKKIFRNYKTEVDKVEMEEEFLNLDEGFNTFKDIK